MSSAPPAATPGYLAAVRHWIDRNVLALGREMRLSYLPPLMVYVAAGIFRRHRIVGGFFGKERVGVFAGFLAPLGFWGGLPGGLKVARGPPVDVVWGVEG